MVGSKDLPPSTLSFGSVFVNNQFRAKPHWPDPSTTDLTGKTAIITGSNSGLGYESARQLLSLKLSHLILAVRTPSKGEAAAHTLRKTLPSSVKSAPKIEVWQLDMCSYASVQAFARRVDTDLPRGADFVLLNAGLGGTSYARVESTGHEEALQVNYLSTALLTILLLPILKSKHAASPSTMPPHLVICGAALALAAKLPPSITATSPTPIFKTLDNPKTFTSPGTYNVSKLLAHMFLWKLSDYVDGSKDVIISIADPAWTRGTNFGSGAPLPVRVVGKGIALMVARSVSVGASCLVDALVGKGVESHGCFLMSWEAFPFASLLYTPEGRAITERVWEETMAEFEFARARGIVESMKNL